MQLMREAKLSVALHLSLISGTFIAYSFRKNFLANTHLFVQLLIYYYFQFIHCHQKIQVPVDEFSPDFQIIVASEKNEKETALQSLWVWSSLRITACQYNKTPKAGLKTQNAPTSNQVSVLKHKSNDRNA